MEQARICWNRLELAGIGWNWYEWSGMVWSGLESSGIVWYDLEWSGMGWNWLELAVMEWNGRTGIKLAAMSLNGLEWPLWAKIRWKKQEQARLCWNMLQCAGIG